MANQQSTSGEEGKSFDSKLIEDVNDLHLPKTAWTQARNAINNSKSGDLGKLGNEPGTLFCTRMPYTVIGAIHLQADMWLMFSTNNTDSEIGIFKVDICTYELLVNDQCLGFNTRDLIIGTSKPTGDCTIDAYFDDSRNPSRFIRVNNKAPHNLYVPYIQLCTDSVGATQVDYQLPSSSLYPTDCITCVNNLPLVLDCVKLRLAPLVSPPCFRVEKGVSGGTLLNGSYFVVAAYTINQQKVTDYYTPSNVQALFEHDNVAGSLDIFPEFTDDRFDEYELVVVATINQQTVARRVGIYSTRQTKITLDLINNAWITVPIEQISLLNPVVDKADAMFSVQDYLLRVGPYNKFDFNYQPLANQIVTKWQSVEYKSDYYRQGGHNTGYMRDEVYALFIRWVYITGDKSASYHIPGRPHIINNNETGASGDHIAADPTNPDSTSDPINERWYCENTATVIPLPVPVILPDGGRVLAEGYMGYWESTELYPDKKPQIWNANILLGPYSGTNNLDYDLCGTPIRHHRMPDNAVHPKAYHFGPAGGVEGTTIRILGLSFENIKPPVDNDGVLIPGIAGYEILRGSRQGNRSVIAKGIFNQTGSYDVAGDLTNRKGVYANYPYNDVSQNPFLTSKQTISPVANIFGNNCGGEDFGILHDTFSDKLFSFHSPDTSFTHPFLSVKELKSYGMYQGFTTGKFDFSEKHPREKIISNVAFIASLSVGLGLAFISMIGKRNKTNNPLRVEGGSTVMAVGSGTSPTLASIPFIAAAQLVEIGFDNAAQIAIPLGANILPLMFGAPTYEEILTPIRDLTINGIAAVATALGSTQPARQTQTEEDGTSTAVPAIFRAFVGIPTFLYYLSEGTDATLRLIKNILRYRDFALKYNSHCFYDTFSNPLRPGEKRREILTSNYIGPNIQDFGNTNGTNVGYRINNQFRSDFVAIELTKSMTPIVNNDNSRRNARVISGPSILAGNTLEEPTKTSFKTNSVCTYVGLKQRIQNQYGQLNSILQMPVTDCVEYLDPLVPVIADQPISLTRSPVMFNGDIYIGRYTEKNTFFYFYEWLFDQPDGYEFDYLKHRMLLFPTYWANFENFETQDFVSSAINAISTLSNPNGWATTLPSSFFYLDGYTCPGPSQFAVKNAWFYLFHSGIRDFFVESEINIDLRDWGTSDSERHYDPYRYTTTKSLFDTSIIKSRNYYKYDYSLSASFTYINKVSWGSLQQTFYDPYLADTCFQHEPKRVIYSLPAQFEAKKDYWRIFLPLNYKDFTAQVTCIKPINKSGAIILFDTASPIMFQGTDVIQTGTGTSLVIGDGRLFEQAKQNLVNADTPYEYASCQNRLSVINTPTGTYWMSQNQGKIYQMSGFGGGLKEISTEDLKWWFATYLPYQLTKDFPDFDLTDNPVSGIGCQAIYDNENSLIYFCKKDYVLRKDIADVITYNVGQQTFMINGLAPVETGDPAYFENASWTMSYDPKTGGWLGWHDWHPDLLLPSKNTFMSISKAGIDPLNPTNIRTNGIWIHNERCDLYCNYYGKDYPFEVEYQVNTIQTVNTLRSVEYIMELYKYAPNCYDRYHILNENFDEAVIYNSEQCSGLLKLDLSPRNDLPLLLQYPKVNFTNIQILYSKVENKYRFNMANDMTRERGGQNIGLPGAPAFAEQTIWNTQSNGYIKVLNPNNLAYNKNPLELKKFRHYTNMILLRKLVCGNVKYLVMLADTKLLNSPR